MKLWLSSGKDLIGPVDHTVQHQHPNGSITFQITGEWKTRLGWGSSAYVEVQARPMPEDRKVPRAVYAWEPD
jgi:hypothetical protein